MLNIRNEEPRDYETVENITRDAFYNLYILGCVEHYLVHTMRHLWDMIPWIFLEHHLIMYPADL